MYTVFTQAHQSCHNNCSLRAYHTDPLTRLYAQYMLKMKTTRPVLRWWHSIQYSHSSHEFEKKYNHRPRNEITLDRRQKKSWWLHAPQSSDSFSATYELKRGSSGSCASCRRGAGTGDGILRPWTAAVAVTDKTQPRAPSLSTCASIQPIQLGPSWCNFYVNYSLYAL